MADYRNSNYDPDRRYSTRNTKNTGIDVGYWMLAGFLLLAGAWPISLVMLISKLSKNSKKRSYDRPRDSAGRFVRVEDTQAQPQPQPRAAKQKQYQPRKAAKVLMIIGAIVTIIGALASFGIISELISWGYYNYLMEELFTFLGFIVFGGCMYGGGLGMKRKDARIRQYLNIIGEQRIVLIKTLASAAGVSTRRVYKDLDEMIEDGILPTTAYVDRARKCLVLDAAAMPYQSEAEAVLKQQQAVKAAAAQPVVQARQPAAEEPAADADGEYDTILAQIRRANDDIEDEVMSAKIDHIEAVASSIFSIVEEKPERRQEIRNFFSYYLPTTQKLLNFYAQLEEQPVQSETIRESRKNIEGIMDNLVKGFESQLDALFRADALDISTDISVLENMLAQDGLGNSVHEDAIARAAASRGPSRPIAAPRAAGTVDLGGMAAQRIDLPN